MDSPATLSAQVAGSLAPRQDVVERFAQIIDDLCAAIVMQLVPRTWLGRFFGGISRPMLMRMCEELRGFGDLIRAAAAGIDAGAAHADLEQGDLEPAPPIVAKARSFSDVSGEGPGPVPVRAPSPHAEAMANAAPDETMPVGSSDKSMPADATDETLTVDATEKTITVNATDETLTVDATVAWARLPVLADGLTNLAGRVSWEASLGGKTGSVFSRGLDSLGVGLPNSLRFHNENAHGRETCLS